ncbi:hypothetical protein CVD28_25720 [Bacillus sp. M6-12]|uniref:hypothetical protein n=1 Tax=Bacillus sp. M6-12 TaxID=2054166 RepID=UPI000C7563E7|nr:hypothetical protein [Bacillus sp. M6-12]PLS14919.1 hypothetical protein CVD28_25720 [Bacillus sp. M6-12]
MNSEEMRREFIKLIKLNFPSVQFKERTLPSGNKRISPYIPNKKRNKRWMQLDANPEYFSIAMDHYPGDITEEDLRSINIPLGLDGNRTGCKLQNNNDAVNISVFNNDVYNFNSDFFTAFLEKHYNSYIKLINS